MTAARNRLLAALPANDLARLTGRATLVEFKRRQIVYRAGGPLEFIYFPRSGVVSAVVAMRDGATAEVAAVGREGMLGAAVAVGATRSPEDVYCQVEPSACLRVPAPDFAAEVARGGPLQAVVHAYLRAMLAVAARQAACNALHGVTARCARWLLTVRDRVGAGELPLTHEFLAVMLGARRATVTAAAQALQAEGLVRYHRGRVTVLDGPGLERAACECYRVIRALLPDRPPPA